jgi:hypothetical protein
MEQASQNLLTEKLAEKMGSLKVARGTEEGVRVGPLIDESQRTKVASLINASDGGARRAAWPRRRASVVEDRHVEPAQARRVGEDVDLHDLSASDREAHDRKRPSTRGHDDARGPIHERRSYKRGEP